MPFRSEKQRKFLWAFHPDIAKRWSEEYGGKLTKSKRSKNGRRKTTRKNSSKRY